MEVTIDASLPKLHQRGALRVLRSISFEGLITYQMIEASGDGAIRREVIDRYLTAESQASEEAPLRVTPTLYHFHFKGAQERQGRRLYVFQLTPKKKRAGQFKGELWLDGLTGLPVRESGEFVKSPSIFVKRIVFVRDYELRDGLSLPARIHGVVETRLVGRAELDIRFSGFRRMDQEEATE